MRMEQIRIYCRTDRVALPTKQSSNLGLRIGAYLRRMQKAARRGLVGGCERDDAPGCCGTAQAKPSGELPVRRRVRTEIGFGRKERESGGKMSRPPGICWADQGGYCFGLNSWIACYFNYIFICPLKKPIFSFCFFSIIQYTSRNSTAQNRRFNWNRQRCLSQPFPSHDEMKQRGYKSAVLYIVPFNRYQFKPRSDNKIKSVTCSEMEPHPVHGTNRQW
jgi:hypothetical protein